MYQTCQIFQNNSPMKAVKEFYFGLKPALSDEEISTATTDPPTCFDIQSQIVPGGKTLFDSGGDYNDGMAWDFQVCTDVVFILGFSNQSMLPPRHASYDDLTLRCRERFGVTPRPFQLVDKWDFANLQDRSYILFTNGVLDIWSGGSIMHNVSDTVLALNFPNGAHHSDLTHGGPTEYDSDDIKAGHVQIQNILEKWLDQIRKDPLD